MRFDWNTLKGEKGRFDRDERKLERRVVEHHDDVRIASGRRATVRVARVGETRRG